jgi:hypothetical protein
VRAAHDVRVDLQRRRHVAMAEEFLRASERDAGRVHEAFGKMPQVVEAQFRRAGAAQRAVQDMPQ